MPPRRVRLTSEFKRKHSLDTARHAVNLETCGMRSNFPPREIPSSETKAAPDVLFNILTVNLLLAWGENLNMDLKEISVNALNWRQWLRGEVTRSSLNIQVT